ncbi:O-methylsterigmatocystin oxidoreductase [Mycena sanguinolenta]|uniref:O-methylsterigmatocystin oxidoreductase n=1 Tax=Mycena sanguinolenta TaxID=230812 RepID=A0A8H6YKQ1_9AGAR|nr:O-methylsterigmatocystin oxidoreductase [Mycena sanguinolenta]
MKTGSSILKNIYLVPSYSQPTSPIRTYASSMPLTMLVAILSAATAALTYFVYHVGRSPSLPFPPGPPQDPIIGHLRCMPSKRRATVFHKWAKIYGDVIYLNVLGKSMIVLNTEKVALDLLTKRSSIYSDRPRFVLYEMIGWSTTLSLMPYGKQFMRQRRLHQSYLSRDKCREFRSMQTLEARTLVKNLLESAPEGYSNLINRFSTGVTSQIVAGHRILSDDDPYMRTTQALRDSLGRSGVPGSTALDFLPFLRYLPAWFPGFPFGAIARECRPRLQRLYDLSLQAVKHDMVSRLAKPSFLRTQLERMGDTTEPQNYDDIKWAAAGMFGSTIWSTVTVFVLAMLLHPEYQIKAKEEIDSVVGKSRLPDFDDREHLPLVECIMQETLRWKPPTELGVPHRLMEDDVYEGMFIPAGSTVFANIRAMSLDESRYSSPETFYPERFFPKPEGKGEPYFASVYGFGRRICSGQHLADQSLWIAIATILASCTISNAYDKHGNVIVPDQSMSDGVSSHPNDFSCVFSCRDPKLRAWL